MSVTLSDYFKSYFAEKLQDQVLKPGDNMLDPTCRFLQKRREVMDVNEDIKLKRKDFESTLKALQVRKRWLRQNEEQFLEYLQKFDNFLEEREEKKRIAVRNAGKERELTSQKQVDLSNLREEMKAVIKKRDSLAKRVQKNAIYSCYLDEVVQANDKFQEVQQVISRYDTLLLTLEDMVLTTQQNEDSREKARAYRARFIEQSNNTLLHDNRTIAELQSQLDYACNECLIHDSNWARIQNTAAKKTLMLGTVRMAILNEFESLWKRGKDTSVSTVLPMDTPKQLAQIQTHLADLTAIWEEVSAPDQTAPEDTDKSIQFNL
ncbi:hypothetical protein UPYG_G00002040 [Umbra pygmaea]|uniref:DUF4200 domain-containing protein n=1 Tax=Umbra pygmaea TaxID=75934 RepID=A0ABD0XGL8_UMBPY